MGDAHSATDFHFLFLNPPALTNFTDDQRPLAEENTVRERHVGRLLERTRNRRFEVDSNSFLQSETQSMPFSQILCSPIKLIDFK